MDQALNAHVKILDYSCSQERDAQKAIWVDKCVEELKNGDKWALPALKQIREICCLYEPNPNLGHSQRSHHLHYRYNGTLMIYHICKCINVMYCYINFALYCYIGKK